MEKVTMISPIELVDIPNRALASVDISVQPDLLYMKSVLVSAGWNDNDDFFLPKELWQARLTPKLKPVDWEHNTGQELLDNALGTLKDPKKIVQDNQIVGVMHNAYAADSTGPIDDTKDDFIVPNKFNVINEAVIFKYLFPKTAAKIVKEAQDNKLFVSMEAWFTNYDYIVGNKVVARNETTSFLDKHLRIRGGEGKFGNERIGRVLRNITFGGVGLVSRPANKDSIIESFTNASQEEVIDMQNESKAVEAATELADKLAKAESELKSKEADLVIANKKIEEMLASLETFKGTITKGSETLVKAAEIDSSKTEDVFATIAQFIIDMKESAKKTAAELEVASAKLAAIEAEKVYASRLALIVSELQLAKSSDDSDELIVKKEAKAKKLAELVSTYSEEAFASWLAEVKDILTLTSAKMPPWMDKEKEKDKKKDAKAEETDSAEASEIVDPKVLDNVMAEAPIPAGSDTTGNVVKLSDRMKSLAAELLSAAKK